MKGGTADNPFYVVTFALPIGSCAAQVQPGYAGGDLQAGHFNGEAIHDPGLDNAFDITFRDDCTGERVTTSAFMLIVTCPA